MGFISSVVKLSRIEEEINTLLLASSNDIIEKLLGNLDIYQKKLFNLDDAVARSILADYKSVRSQLQEDLTSFWNDTFRKGIQPTQSELVDFVQKHSLLTAIDKRLSYLEGKTVDEITDGVNRAAQLGYESMVRELNIVSKFENIAQKITLDMLVDPVAHELTIKTAIADTRNLTNHSREVINRQLSQGAIMGEGIRDLRNRIKTLDDVGENRADMISRWATIKGFNQSRQIAYEKAKGLIPGLKKMWVTAQDRRTCPICAALHGEIIEVEAEFDASLTFGKSIPPKPYGALMIPPRHPRCRCSLVSWMEHWRGATRFSPEKMKEDAREWALEHGYSPTVRKVEPKNMQWRKTVLNSARLNSKDLRVVPRNQFRFAINEFRECLLPEPAPLIVRHGTGETLGRKWKRTDLDSVKLNSTDLRMISKNQFDVAKAEFLNCMIE